MRRVLSFAWKEQESLKDGSSCTWVVCPRYVDGISCSTSSVDDAAAAKNIGSDRIIVVWHGEKRKTMYLASVDIKTVFVVEKPKAHCEQYGRSRSSRMVCSGFRT